MTRPNRRLLIACAAVAATLVAIGLALGVILGAPAAPLGSETEARPASAASARTATSAPAQHAFTIEAGAWLTVDASVLVPDDAAAGPYRLQIADAEQQVGLTLLAAEAGFGVFTDEPATLRFRASVHDQDGLRIAATTVTVVVTGIEPEAFGPADDRFKIPALGIDAELKAMSVSANGRVNPATPTDVYAIRGFGDPRVLDSGTTYLAVHSGRGGVVGNQLVDVSGAASAVEPGTRIIVAGAPFVVTESAVVGKDRLTSDEQLWSGEHDLIILTCLPNGAKSIDNVVIFARRA